MAAVTEPNVSAAFSSGADQKRAFLRFFKLLQADCCLLHTRYNIVNISEQTCLTHSGGDPFLHQFTRVSVQQGSREAVP